MSATSQEPEERHVAVARTPIALRAPASMRKPIDEVLAGEYEAGFFGEELTILDIGANVGAFSLWANLRWPRSRIHAYEPHPGTFAMLRENLGAHGNVELHNAALYPTDGPTLDYVGRYDGDGEAGVAECMKATFAVDPDQKFTVAALHPRDLPAADVVKLDVEGAEADILAAMDLTGVSLILLEYQNDANRRAIHELLGEAFEVVFEDAFDWDELLPGSGYRPDLAGDHWGRTFFARREGCRLQRLAPPRAPVVVAASDPTAPAARPLHRRIRDRLKRLIGQTR